MRRVEHCSVYSKLRSTGAKRGDEKYYIIISLILGLMILGMSLYFIFQEYFTEEDINYETCRQSIVLRASIPEAEWEDFELSSFKNNFPLKCKNEITFISADDPLEEVNQIVMAARDSCWSLVGEGEWTIFPMEFFEGSSQCIICSRINFDEESKNKYSQFYNGADNLYIGVAYVSGDGVYSQMVAKVPGLSDVVDFANKREVGKTGQEARLFTAYNLKDIQGMCTTIETIPA